MAYFLTTARLAFREITHDDLDFIAEMVGDPLVMRFYPYVMDRAGAQKWISRAIERQARDGHSFWLVANKETHEPIGQVGLLKQEVDGATESEIGYMLHRSHWRQGFAHEAAAAVRDYAFGGCAFGEGGKQRVISLVRPANIPSQRVALSYGAKPEKLVTWRDYEHIVFALENPANSRL